MFGFDKIPEETTGAERAAVLMARKLAWQAVVYAALPNLSGRMRPHTIHPTRPRRMKNETFRPNAPLASRAHVSSRVIERKLPRMERLVMAGARKTRAADKRAAREIAKAIGRGSKIVLVGA